MYDDVDLDVPFTALVHPLDVRQPGRPAKPDASAAKCSLPDCDAPVRCSGMCSKHYTADRRERQHVYSRTWRAKNRAEQRMARGLSPEPDPDYRHGKIPRGMEEVDGVLLSVALINECIPAPAPGWREWANCKDLSPEDFYPAPNMSGAPAMPYRLRCIACAVRTECLQEALRGGESGCWGGTTERTRAGLLRTATREGRPIANICVTCDKPYMSEAPERPAQCGCTGPSPVAIRTMGRKPMVECGMALTELGVA